MKIQLIRHATLWLEYGSRKFLIDPMFAKAGANPPVMNSANDRRNPLVPLPMGVAVDQLLHPDAVVVTHLHPDHWDEAAAMLLPKTTPILCQPGDESHFESLGFTRVSPIVNDLEFGRVSLVRTGGQHGTGEIGQMMGSVSGFVFRAPCEPTLYLAGDTIWCEEVIQALDDHHPDVVVVNAGGARFLTGGPITMDDDQIVSLCRHAPDTQVIAVHMDAINHCLVTRSDLRRRLEAEGLTQQVAIPEDGEWVNVTTDHLPAN
ncbi:MBL fold metallo-hydrolase [Paenibacillus puldeungensis]|uniref:MBL fold metallo-hydrolase n=1 Tax=Paenibacillus puldeungensis TaxID=696536 RepID=A0ABW3RS28_9BACL